MDWVQQEGLSLYPAQEEALIEAFGGSHVIVNTPTGSGKSLIALGSHVAGIARGERSFYTAPVKALVSEKFFSLCEAFGSRNVGMLTGDASINPDAPLICATAEVLANLALNRGDRAGVGQVVMDEFHFYGDPERGWAWQVPLLELTSAQFVLMSATLGDTRIIEEGIKRRTGRPVAVIRSVVRPVPLRFEYRHTPLHATVESLLGDDQAPIYLVFFTQAQVLAEAQSLTSAQVSTRAQREAVAEAISGYRFAPGFGRTLSRLLRHGIGVHHGGMLPKYRRLVERLTREGLLRIVVGTDTLGVGVNMPLRTVVLSGLSKYDGTVSRLLSARELHQIAGRAGRAGYDTSGLVVVQAPPHVIDNEEAVRKAGGDARKLRKLVRAKPPRNFVAWDEAVFDKLVSSPPETLVSHMTVTHSTVLDVLDRPGDGCRALRRLVTDNFEQPASRRRLARTAIGIYRSLLGVGALERLGEPDGQGRMVRVNVDLQRDFALDAPLSPFILEALPRLDRQSPTWVLDVVSVVESTLANPGPVLAAQLDKLRSEAMTAMKAAGVPYEERIEALEKLEYPKPLRDWTYELFDSYRAIHPWVADFNIAPKSVARDLFERAMNFSEYIAHYGLVRSEGLVLRYLTDVYKALVRSVPEDAKNDELVDFTEWLGELVRQVDSSLLDEWRTLTALQDHPSGDGPQFAAGTGAERSIEERPPKLSANRRAFAVMIRNAAFRRVEMASRRDVDGLAGSESSGGLDRGQWAEVLAGYFSSHASIGIGAPARAAAWFQVREGPGIVEVRQVIDDPEGFHDCVIVGEVDVEESDETGVISWRTLRVEVS
ncbi:MAG: DEAD/DEAH box helicase [Acidimicrobiales bacterium]